MSFSEDEVVIAGIANTILEILHFIMAHPTHLTVIVYVAIVARAMNSTMAHTRAIAIETKSLEEQRDMR